MSDGIERLIKSTNRFILINSIKIPIIWDLDEQSNIIKNSKFPNLIFTGYLIRLDGYNNVFYEGQLF